ncbi:MAG: hypothetical protein GHCLOJNM_01937 [bacterium]|nr:hypothetical protein [bacterium]
MKLTLSEIRRNATTFAVFGIRRRSVASFEEKTRHFEFPANYQV